MGSISAFVFYERDVMFKHPSQYSGCFLDFPEYEHENIDSLCKALALENVLHYGKTGWFIARLYSRINLLPTTQYELAAGFNSQFEYDVLLRKSGSRLIIGAYHKNILYSLIDQNIRNACKDVLVVYRFKIHKLAFDVTTTDTNYALTYIHAKTQGSGASLRSVSFFGNDLADARFFKNNLELFTFYTCGLRCIDSNIELIRLNSAGTFFFRLGEMQVAHSKELERFFHYLRMNGYIDGNY